MVVVVVMIVRPLTVPFVVLGIDAVHPSVADVAVGNVEAVFASSVGV